jgi:hypothetical protein
MLHPVEMDVQSYAIHSHLHPYYHISAKYTVYLYSDAESKDRALQQRVRRLHFKLEKGTINPDSPVGIEKDYDDHIALGKRACEFLTKSTDPFLATKSCSDALSEAGFVKLSKREPFAGKLSPGEVEVLVRQIVEYIFSISFNPFVILLFRLFPLTNIFI